MKTTFAYWALVAAVFSSFASGLDAQVLNWTNKASLPQAAYVNGARSFGVATNNGKLCLVGGLNFPNAIATVFQYDPSSDTWTQLADMLTNRYAPAAVSLNGHLYAIGGSTGNGQTVLSTMEEYDPASNTWTQKASMQNARWAFQAVAVNGKIYAIGGLGGSSANPIDAPYVEEYDPVSDSWTSKSNMPVPRTSFGAVAWNGKIYVIGGYDYNNNHTYIADVHVYDPVSDTWTTNAPIPTLRETLAVVTVNHRIWAMGGTDPSNESLAIVEEFDPAQNSWTSGPDLPTARNECYGAVFGNTLYVFGGYNLWTMQAAFSGFGSVIVYDNQLTYTTRGGGGASTLTASGWIVWDTQTWEMAELALYKSHKMFQVTTNQIEIYYFTGAAGTKHIVAYVQPNSGVSGLGTATGIATSLEIGTSPIVSYASARTFTVSSSYVYAINLTTYLQTVTGSLTYDSMITHTQNQIDGNFDNTVQRLTDLLLSKGYRQSN